MNLKPVLSQKNDLILGWSQENLMEFLSTVYLPYIHFAHGLCYTNLVYSKGTCVEYTV